MKILDRHFPDLMPGFPDYPSANDNSATEQAMRHIHYALHVIRLMDRDEAHAAIITITRELDKTLNFIESKHT